MLARLKREWRAEWDAEQARKDERSEAELIDSINRKLDAARLQLEQRSEGERGS